MNLVWKKIILHIFLPLLAGLLLYIYTGPDTWIVQQIVPQNLRADGQIKTAHWGMKLLVNSGADFCWSYSFASALFLWKDLADIQVRFFPFIVVLIVLLFEVVQLLFPRYLTFDVIDLVAAFPAVLLSRYLNRPVHVKKV